MRISPEWRLSRYRKRGFGIKECCGFPEPRPSSPAQPCVNCGTRLSLTTDGFAYTKFGEDYWEKKNGQEIIQIEFPKIRQFVVV